MADSCVHTQAIMTSNEAYLPSQTPAVQLQLRKLCMAHTLAAARFACFADRPQVLQAAAQACWNMCLPLTDSAEGRSILAEKLEDLAGLMCELKCQDAAFQVLLKHSRTVQCVMFGRAIMQEVNFNVCHDMLWCVCSASVMYLSCRTVSLYTAPATAKGMHVTLLVQIEHQKQLKCEVVY